MLLSSAALLNPTPQAGPHPSWRCALMAVGGSHTCSPCVSAVLFHPAGCWHNLPVTSFHKHMYSGCVSLQSQTLVCLPSGFNPVSPSPHSYNSCSFLHEGNHLVWEKPLVHSSTSPRPRTKRLYNFYITKGFVFELESVNSQTFPLMLLLIIL